MAEPTDIEQFIDLCGRTSGPTPDPSRILGWPPAHGFAGASGISRRPGPR